MKTLVRGMEAVHEAVPFILMDAEGGEYENYSNDGSDFVSLKHMKSMSLARDNCYATTDFLLENGLIAGNLKQPHRLYRIVGQHPSEIESHCAVLVEFTETQERIVLDFTARQYYSVLPFPVILPEDEWTEFLREYIEEFDLTITEAG